MAATAAAVMVSGAQAAGHGKSATLGEYTKPKTPVVHVAGAAGVAGAHVAAAKPTVAHGSLPFTGIDLALMTSGGMGLVLFGAGLRRFGRNKA